MDQNLSLTQVDTCNRSELEGELVRLRVRVTWGVDLKNEEIVETIKHCD